jgi:hypothetical protein
MLRANFPGRLPPKFFKTNLKGAKFDIYFFHFCRNRQADHATKLCLVGDGGACASAVMLTFPIPCNAQSSIALARAEPAKAYFAIKRLLAAEIQRDRVPADFPKDAPSLESCLTVVGKIGPTTRRNDLRMELAGLAYEILYIRFSREGIYPDEQWRPRLINLEKDLRKKKGPDLSKFRPIISPRPQRVSKNQRADAATRESGYPGCGADEVPVLLTASPKPTRIQHLQRLFYDLCAVQQASDCDWNDYGGKAAQLSVRYKVRFTWPDGRIRDADMTVHKITPDKRVRIFNFELN